MKKSIIYSALALVAFCNVAMASSSNITTSGKFPSEFTKTLKATPLAQAIAKGDVATVKKFIGYGIDVNEKSNDMTPLMIAARYNEVEIINLLLANGANAKEINTKGFSALKYAQLSNANNAITVLTQEISK